MIEFKDLKTGQSVIAQLKETNPWTKQCPELLEPFEATVDTACGEDWVGVVQVGAGWRYLHLEDTHEYAGIVLKIIEQQEEENDGQSS